MRQPSERQQAIQAYLERFIEEKGYPPSIRQIQEACHISSTSVVDYNLRLLEKRGVIRRDREVSRGIEILGEGPAKPAVGRVPLLGAIAAGAPIPVPEAGSRTEPEEWVDVPESMLRGRRDVFALRVKGTSMIDALINDGDIVLIRAQQAAEPGERVVAWLTDTEETTLKRFHPEDGRVRLQPENSTMDPIYVEAENVKVQGKVVGVLRDIEG